MVGYSLPLILIPNRVREEPLYFKTATVTILLAAMPASAAVLLLSRTRGGLLPRARPQSLVEHLMTFRANPVESHC